MSRIGKKPIPIPQGVKVQVGEGIVRAEGPKGKLSQPIPSPLSAEIDKQTAITLRGADKALLGETAAKLRALRKPDPYKGKGIRYSDEYVRRKVGKKAGAK